MCQAQTTPLLPHPHREQLQQAARRQRRAMWAQQVQQAPRAAETLAVQGVLLRRLMLEEGELARLRHEEVKWVAQARLGQGQRGLRERCHHQQLHLARSRLDPA